MKLLIQSKQIYYTVYFSLILINEIVNHVLLLTIFSYLDDT